MKSVARSKRCPAANRPINTVRIGHSKGYKFHAPATVASRSLTVCSSYATRLTCRHCRCHSLIHASHHQVEMNIPSYVESLSDREIVKRRSGFPVVLILAGRNYIIAKVSGLTRANRELQHTVVLARSGAVVAVHYRGCWGLLYGGWSK